MCSSGTTRTPEFRNARTYGIDRSDVSKAVQAICVTEQLRSVTSSRSQSSNDQAAVQVADTVICCALRFNWSTIPAAPAISKFAAPLIILGE
jgi:hypothetical protein